MGWLPPLLAFAWIALGCGVLPEEPRRYLSAVLQQYAGGLQTRPLLYHEPGIGEGHGSRWLGILTCFYLALAANRTLHVLWPTTQPGRGHLMPPLASLYTTHAIMQPSTDRLTFEALKHVALFKVSYGASYTNLSAVLHITSAPFASSLGPQRPALCHSTQWISIKDCPGGTSSSSPQPRPARWPAPPPTAGTSHCASTCGSTALPPPWLSYCSARPPCTPPSAEPKGHAASLWPPSHPPHWTRCGAPLTLTAWCSSQPQPSVSRRAHDSQYNRTLQQHLEGVATMLVFRDHCRSAAILGGFDYSSFSVVPFVGSPAHLYDGTCRPLPSLSEPCTWLNPWMLRREAGHYLRCPRGLPCQFTDLPSTPGRMRLRLRGRPRGA
eukprot:GGOE01022676.1.p1 GENE.GGOE01022676.1~~GGOE01022676.1.p1  ORF type:complete len:381 (-),score=23.34 GGOE01022676.1:349-1491(-)